MLSLIFFLYDEKIKDDHKQFIKIMQNDDKFKHYSNDLEQLYVINDVMKQILATHVDKIIRKINIDSSYNEIDLIGISVSGGISTFLAQMKTIQIRQLILMAPGILEGLKNIPINQNIILCWCIQDTKVPYNIEGKRLINDIKSFNNKTIVLIDLGSDTLDDDITHRLQDGVFDII